jgi:hypothetical protein
MFKQGHALDVACVAAHREVERNGSRSTGLLIGYLILLSELEPEHFTGMVRRLSAAVELGYRDHNTLRLVDDEAG